MVVNFRARGINRGARKLARTPTLNKNKNSSLEKEIDVLQGGIKGSSEFSFKWSPCKGLDHCLAITLA